MRATVGRFGTFITIFVTRDDDVCGFLAGDVLAARVSERRQVETRHEMFFQTEENGGDG
jgi:hypothetical protein